MGGIGKNVEREKVTECLFSVARSNENATGASVIAPNLKVSYYRSMDQNIARQHLQATIDLLRTKKRILFITTSTRVTAIPADRPKSTQLAEHIAAQLVPGAVTVIDVTKIKIHPCEGNISAAEGNNCGVAKAVLADPVKNPTGLHRCWASINNPDDELWKVSKPLLGADAVVFFGSVRWGQMNAQYQQLIERLSWLENRHSTLKEKNILAQTTAGIIAIGHNWRGHDVVKVQKQVLTYFGFDVQPDLCWNWDFTSPDDESAESYKKAAQVFEETFLK